MASLFGMARAAIKDPEAVGQVLSDWGKAQALKTGGLGGELGVNYQGKMWGWGAASAFGINSGAGAAIGAATNGDDRLKGALWGGAVGGGLGLAGRGALTMALRDSEIRSEALGGLGKMGFGEVHGPFRNGQTATMSKSAGGGIKDAVAKAKWSKPSFNMSTSWATKQTDHMRPGTPAGYYKNTVRAVKNKRTTNAWLNSSTSWAQGA